MMMGGGMSGGVVGGKGPRSVTQLDGLEAARQQNLEKIQQLQETLQAAHQQEAQFKSQMDIMSHLHAAQQQEQHYKQLEVIIICITRSKIWIASDSWSFESNHNLVYKEGVKQVKWINLNLNEMKRNKMKLWEINWHFNGTCNGSSILFLFSYIQTIRKY